MPEATLRGALTSAGVHGEVELLAHGARLCVTHPRTARRFPRAAPEPTFPLAGYELPCLQNLLTLGIPVSADFARPIGDKG